MEKLEIQIKTWQYLYLIERGLNIVKDIDGTRVYDGSTCLMYIDPNSVIDPEVKIFTDKLLKKELIAIVNNL